MPATRRGTRPSIATESLLPRMPPCLRSVHAFTPVFTLARAVPLYCLASHCLETALTLPLYCPCAFPRPPPRTGDDGVVPFRVGGVNLAAARAREAKYTAMLPLVQAHNILKLDDDKYLKCHFINENPCVDTLVPPQRPNLCYEGTTQSRTTRTRITSIVHQKISSHISVIHYTRWR